MARTSPAAVLPPRLSIVIPAYNEAERLETVLRAIAEHPTAKAAEVIVVDDGSADATSAVAERTGRKLGLVLRTLRHEPNRGKGFAVRRGMLEAGGGAVLLTDADLSVSMDHVDRFLARLAEGADAVFGSRRAAGARIEIHQSVFRERLGHAFRNLARWLLVPGVSDFTCGFKLFSRRAAQQIFARQRLWGWGFDVEIALVARRRGLRVAEEPVVWRDDARTRVRLLRDVARSAWDLVRIAWNDVRGLY